PSGPCIMRSQVPPAFTSIREIVFVKPLGPHQCLICSGSVHTFQTKSRGAFNNLVMVSSLLGDNTVSVAIILFFEVIELFFGFFLFFQSRLAAFLILFFLFIL